MFDASTYRERRQQLVERDQPDTGIILLLGNGQSPANYADNAYPFRQDSTFLYYFGLDVPNLYGIVDLDNGTSTLYGEETDVEDVVWTGGQPSLREQADAGGVSSVGSPADLRDRLARALDDDRSVHVLPPYRAEHRLRYRDLLGADPTDVEAFVSEPLIRAVVSQRSVKTDHEIAEIEKALKVTARIHEYAMRHATPGTTERDIYGAITGIATAEGVSYAFPPTCSIRGEVLHNHTYDNTLAEGDFLLLDAGLSSGEQYASDITRTTPVGGDFSSQQMAIYEAVLAAQKTALDALEPGVPFKEVHLASARELTRQLIDIGLMSGSPEEAVAAGAHALFFPHGLGHMMGLDVHDMENLGEEYVGYGEGYSRSDQFGLDTLRLARPLRARFVVTVEPGCYFIPTLIERWQAENKHEAFLNYDEIDHFVGLGGVRLEDDVLITHGGYRTLGPAIPKAPAQVAEQVGSME